MYIEFEFLSFTDENRYKKFFPNEKLLYKLKKKFRKMKEIKNKLIKTRTKEKNG